MQQTKEVNILALSGTRTRDPSNQAAADLHIRPHDSRDWLINIITSIHSIHSCFPSFVRCQVFADR
jgi:hypothetical protein